MKKSSSHQWPALLIIFNLLAFVLTVAEGAPATTTVALPAPPTDGGSGMLNDSPGVNDWRRTQTEPTSRTISFFKVSLMIQYYCIALAQLQRMSIVATLSIGKFNDHYNNNKFNIIIILLIFAECQVQTTSRRRKKLWSDDDKCCLWLTRTRSARKCRQWCSILESIKVPATQLSVHCNAWRTQTEENNVRQQGGCYLQAISSVWMCMRGIDRESSCSIAGCNMQLHHGQCNATHISPMQIMIIKRTIIHKHAAIA